MCAASRKPPTSTIDTAIASHPSQAVAAVTGLDQRVGAEGGHLLGREQLVENSPIADLVEVVDDLATLVAEKTVVLVPDRSIHDAIPSRVSSPQPCTRGRANPPPRQFGFLVNH